MILRNIGWWQDSEHQVTRNIRPVNFHLFKDLLDEIPWETVLRDIGMKQSWQHFVDTFLRPQELSIPLHKKSRRRGRKPAWLSKSLLVKQKEKKEKYRQWKQRWVAWVEYRLPSCGCSIPGGIQRRLDGILYILL